MQMSNQSEPVISVLVVLGISFTSAPMTSCLITAIVCSRVSHMRWRRDIWSQLVDQYVFNLHWETRANCSLLQLDIVGTSGPKMPQVWTLWRGQLPTSQLLCKSIGWWIIRQWSHFINRKRQTWINLWGFDSLSVCPSFTQFTYTHLFLLLFPWHDLTTSSCDCLTASCEWSHRHICIYCRPTSWATRTEAFRSVQGFGGPVWARTAVPFTHHRQK